MTTKTVMCKWRATISQRILGAVGFFHPVESKAMISCTDVVDGSRQGGDDGMSVCLSV